MTSDEVLADGAMSVPAAAEFIGVGRTLLYAEMQAGRLQFLKLGRRRVIPRRALLAWAAAGLQGGWAAGDGQAVSGFGSDSQGAAR